MNVVIVPLRTKLSGLYRHRRGLGFTWSRLQRRKYNIRIAKLVFHAEESPIRTWDRVLSLVSSRSNSPAIRIPPNAGLPHSLLYSHYYCTSLWLRYGWWWRSSPAMAPEIPFDACLNYVGISPKRRGWCSTTMVGISLSDETKVIEPVGELHNTT